MKTGDKVIAKKEYHPLKGWSFCSKVGKEYVVYSMIGKFIVRIEIYDYTPSFGLYKDKRRLKKYGLPAFSEYFYTEQEIRKEKLLQVMSK